MQNPQPAPRVARFERLAYGLFVHWGLFSLVGRCVWGAHPKRYPQEEYRTLPARFDAREFDARALAALARRSGMRYATLTTRQHDGFSLYDTRGLSEYDVLHSAARRDLVREFVEGCRAEGLVPLLYHTTYDWSHPAFEADFDGYLEYLRASVELLCSHYGEIGGFWFDGNWSRPEADWKEDALYATIRRLQPEAVIINNTGVDALGATGHPEIDCVTFEQGRPTAMDRSAAPKYLATEMCHSMNHFWGIAPGDLDYLSPRDVVESLCACRRVGANYLLNVGPTAGGGVPALEAALLERAGGWVERWGEILREGRPCGVSGPGKDFGLEADGRLYLFVHDLTPPHAIGRTAPAVGPGPRVFRGIEREARSARWLDSDEALTVEWLGTGELRVTCTGYPWGVDWVVRVAVVE